MKPKTLQEAAALLGKMGGLKTSDKKKKSSAQNGKKGGAPKKYKAPKFI
jgi:hypothetical protein